MATKKKKKSYSDNVLVINDVEFVFAGTNKGHNCTHYLFRSKRVGYLVSYTDIEMASLDWLQPNGLRVTPWSPTQEAREKNARANGVPLSEIHTVQTRAHGGSGTRKKRSKTNDLFEDSTRFSSSL